jgi:Cu-processing system permease protein
MRALLVVAGDILREAASRKWFLFLGGAITLVLGLVSAGLKMDVVDGALAATRLFGKPIDTDIRSADIALRPLFEAATYVVYYGGLVFGILACADFGPSLLSPGRIEHLLSLPLRRWQLLVGTFLGVFILSLIGAIYGSGGLALVLGIKTGVWSARPVEAALLASASFSCLYAAMLAAAVLVRSAAFSAAVGGGLFVVGIVASYRLPLGKLFEAGLGRTAFLAATFPLPRISAVADAAARIASSEPMAAAALAQLVLGIAVFGLGALAVGIWLFEQKDY